MNRALVSIIIPCFNQGRYLHESVNSAVQQTYRDIEVIIVNDGSTDNTAKKSGELQSAFPGRIIISEQENRGLASARQTGFERACGDFIVLLDADDILYPNMIDTCLDILIEDSKQDGVAGWVKRTLEDGKTPVDTLRPRLPLSWPEVMEYNPIGACNAVLLRRSSVERAGGFYVERCRACEDWDLWIRMTLLNMKIGGTDECIAVYRQHEHSLSCDPILMLEEKIILLSRYHGSSCRESDSSKLNKDQFARYVNGSVFHSLGLAIALDRHQEIGRLLTQLQPGLLDDTLCLNQFSVGLNHISEVTCDKNPYTATRTNDFLDLVDECLGQDLFQVDPGWFSCKLKSQLEHRARRRSKFRRAVRKILGKL